MASYKRAPGLMPMAEQLDRTLYVTSARGWIALTAILAVATVAGVWSVVGEASTYVDAHGFLLHRGGTVVDVVAAGRGRLRTIAVAVGDEIERESVVARIANEELAAQYAGTLAFLDERTRALEATEAEVAEASALARANHARRHAQLDELEAAAREVLEAAETGFENSTRLFDNGVIDRARLEGSRQKLNDARRVLIELSRDRGALEEEEIGHRHAGATRIREMTSQVEAAGYRATELAALAAAGTVLAPVSGQVIEIKATVGAVVNPGTPVASIRTGTTDLEVLVYVPPDAGEQVEAGMQALVVPATVKREEFGAIRGTVESLSSFPVSLEGMVAVLQNRSLAQTFFKDGPPYAGRIALVSDPATASGFAWTSPRAARLTLGAGTIAAVEIKTRSQPPIALAIPLLKEWLGL